MSIKSIDLKFTSGNNAPVTRVNITLEEWESVKSTIEILKVGIEGVSNLIEHSNGVDGLHLNGDTAQWESLLEGGNLEEWLLDFSIAQGEVYDPDL